jgi:hypothetical protein
MGIFEHMLLILFVNRLATVMATIGRVVAKRREFN